MDEAMRAWMTRYLMEFGYGPVIITRLREDSWYQSEVGYHRVEDWSDHPTLRKHEGVVFFHWDNSAYHPDRRTYELTQAGLDFIAGGSDDQERVPD